MPDTQSNSQSNTPAKVQITLTIYFTAKGTNPIIKSEIIDKDNKAKQARIIDLFYQFMEAEELFGHGEISYWSILILPFKASDYLID